MFSLWFHGLRSTYNKLLVVLLLLYCRFRLENDDLPMRSDIHPVLLVSSLGHAMHAFVNGVYIGILPLFLFFLPLTFVVVPISSTIRSYIVLDVKNIMIIVMPKSFVKAIWWSLFWCSHMQNTSQDLAMVENSRRVLSSRSPCDWNKE